MESVKHSPARASGRSGPRCTEELLDHIEAKNCALHQVEYVQKAIRRAQQGRTTLLITHRLSQIRWADHILVLDQGGLVASGSHDELLRRSSHYRRIFARYDVELPPLEAVPQTA